MLTHIHLQGGVYAVRRDDTEDSDEVDDEPVPVRAAQSEAVPAVPTGGALPANVAQKLPAHLADHYAKKGMDNVVYFSFCIA